MSEHSSEPQVATQVAYDIDEVPPLARAVPLGLQHMIAMFLGNITPPLIVAGALGLATGQTGYLVQMALLVAGVATLVQAHPIGPVGARLPIVMGTSFAFLGGIIALPSATAWPRWWARAWWARPWRSPSGLPSSLCAACFRPWSPAPWSCSSA